MGGIEINRDLFYKLASDLSEERLQATIELVTQLSKLEKDSSEWQYVLDRLIKGLSSSRNGARLGFSLCLTEVVALALEKGVLARVDQYMHLLISALSKENVKNGKEERGLLFGKLFGLQVLLNEPLFSKVFTADENQLNVELMSSYMSYLIDIALAKTWIRESSLFTLFQAVEKLAPLLGSRQPLKAVLELLDSKGLTQTSEGLAIYLFLLHRCSHTGSVLRKKGFLDELNLKNPWKNNDPLKRGNLPAISNALKDSGARDDPSLTQKGVWAPRLHFAWDIVLQTLLHAENSEITTMQPPSKKRKKEEKEAFIKFPEFWKSVVDESFFNEKSSSERKYLGILVFEKTFQLSPPRYLPQLFSKNLIRCLINQCGSAERNLHKISQKALATIVEVCKAQPEKTAPSFVGLSFGEYGTINFDHLTKTKTVNSLLSNKSLRSDDLMILEESLISNLFGNLKELSRARFILDAILHLVRAHKAHADEVWLKPVLKALVCLGFFQQSELKDVKDSQESFHSLSSIASERLFSILADLLTVEQDTNSVCWPFIAVQLLKTDRNQKTLLQSMDEELGDILDSSMTALSSISQKANEANLSQFQGLQLLFSVNILQAYAGEVESISVLEDLVSFCNEFEDGANSAPLAGFIEILLSLAAQKKALSRKSSLLAWESFVADVTEKDLTVLLNVLSTRENKEGFSNLFEGGSESEGDSEEDEEMNDEEEPEKDASDDEIEESDNNVSGDDSSSDDDMGKIDKEATSALAKALNLPDSIVDDKGEVRFEDLGDTDEEEEESEEDLDDEKMMELDGQLSEIFKRRKEALSKIPTGNKRKQEVKESRENVIAFKHRVVDMLEILVRWIESKMKKDGHIEKSVLDKVFAIILPLLDCIRTTLDKPLAEKIAKLLKNKICKLKPSFSSTTEKVDKEAVLSLLRSVHEAMLVKKAGQFQTLYFSGCSTTSMFLARLVVDISPEVETYEELTGIYHKTLNGWFVTGKFGVSMFVEFLNWLSVKKTQQ